MSTRIPTITAHFRSRTETRQRTAEPCLNTLVRCRNDCVLQQATICSIPTARYKSVCSRDLSSLEERLQTRHCIRRATLLNISVMRRAPAIDITPVTVLKIFHLMLIQNLRSFSLQARAAFGTLYLVSRQLRGYNSPSFPLYFLSTLLRLDHQATSAELVELSRRPE